MGNGDFIEELKGCLESEEKIPQGVVNRLMLRGMMQLYEKIDTATKTEPRIQKLESFMGTTQKVLWIIATPSLVAIGAGIVYLIVAGAP